MNRDVTTFVQQAGKLPSLPTLYYELNRAVEDPNSSISTIGDIVSKDQSLTSRLLKLANSALYSFPSQVETIEEALQLIGLREMRDLALATCVIGAFPNLPKNLVDPTEFWKHSIACGIASALLAEERHDPAPERFFVGGLLHDIGRLVMYLKAAPESLEILRRYESDTLPPHKIEVEVMGFDHAALGAELLSLWKLPLTLIEMVERHHRPAKAPVTMGDDATIHYADFIVSALEFGSSGETVLWPFSAEASQRALPDENRIEPLVSELETRWEPLCAILAKKDHAS
jgi:putative nucleotidyltransferase with HDIG domain